MKKTFTFITMMFLCALMSAQTVNVTFTGRYAENSQYIQLHQVVVENLTRGWTETLFWPDTVLTLTEGTGVQDWSGTSGITLYQNTPNPFNGTTDVQLTVAEPGSVSVDITDIYGRAVVSKNVALSLPGVHQLRVNLPTAGVYLMSVRKNGQVATIKMIGNGGNTKGEDIEYVGAADRQELYSEQTKETDYKGVVQRPFAPSDLMIYEGYAFNANNQMLYSATVQQALGNTSQTITLNFSETDIMIFQPCPGTPVVTDMDGNIYNTLQIGQQCWMRENLRTTHYSDGSPITQGEMGTFSSEPRYYVNPSVDAALYGYYYNWSAAMHGGASSNNIPSGVQGVCPTGWHLPSDTEWTQLTDYMTSQSEYSCGGNNNYIAKALSAKSGWRTSSETCVPGHDMVTNNISGFGTVPAGYYNSAFGAASYNAFFWSSTKNGTYRAYNRYFEFSGPEVHRLEDGDQRFGWSVRCLRD